MTIPASLPKGEYSSLAADKIALVDFRGLLSPEELLELLEEEFEPLLWKWLEKKKRVHGQRTIEGVA